MIPVEVLGLQVEPTTGAPIVLLRESDDPGRVLPVFVGAPEALAIAIGIEGATAARPLTHDLLVDVLDGADTQLERVDVTELVDGTFHAEIELHGPDGSRRISSRPSDAIALAVRLDVPLFASEDVLDEAGMTVADVPDPAEIDAAVDDFTTFLDEVDPADFALPPAPEAADEADHECDDERSEERDEAGGDEPDES